MQQAVFIIHCKFEANILMTMLEDLTYQLTDVYFCSNDVIQLASVDCKDID